MPSMETNNLVSPTNNLADNDSSKSSSAWRDVGMDKNIMMETVELIMLLHLI